MNTVITPPKITTWSFSRWQVYEDCPRRARDKFIRKLPEPSSPALERGAAIHKLAEDYITGKTETFPQEYRLVRNILQGYRDFGGSAELELAVDPEWQAVDWFASTVWGRAKIDSAILFDDGELDIVDWKTGNYKPNDFGYNLQLENYAVFGFATHPEAARVRTRLVFTDSGKTVEKKYEVKEAPKLKTLWLKRVTPMLSDEQFPPKPGPGCRWCVSSHTKGGDCEF